MSLKLFISYAHEDRGLKKALLENLEVLKRRGKIQIWEDSQIEVGADWRKAIGHAMDQCDMALFLVSRHFLASDFIGSVETERLLARRSSDGIRVVPIILRDCPWKQEPHLVGIQVLPNDGKSVMSFRGRDRVWTEIAGQIAQWAQEREASPHWTGDPYPGLRAFDAQEAPIFFGREGETTALLSRIQDGCRFLAVMGASGSGKSSLVRAGLLSQLLARSWRVLTMKPDELGDKNPLSALCAEVRRQAHESGLTEVPEPGDIRAGADAVPRWVEALLHGALPETELLLFVDQFEELFTEVDEKARPSFTGILAAVARHPRGRVVVTLRSDFYPQFGEDSALVECLNTHRGAFSVSPLGPDRYREIICEPAKLAGFSVELELLKRIMDDARGAPGAVPLIAFTLNKLYAPFRDRGREGEHLLTRKRVFTLDTYKRFGGLRGAIKDAAEDAVAGRPDLAAGLPRLFRVLVSVGLDREPTRLRVPGDQRKALEADPACKELVGQLVGDGHHARLLIADRETLEVADETLFSAWTRLKDWISENRTDLYLRETMRVDARRWRDAGENDPMLLWPHERQAPLFAALERLGEDRSSLPEWEQRFLRPEAERLLQEINGPQTSHDRRERIGARLAEIGDPRPGVLPDADGQVRIEWCDVPEGTVRVEDREDDIRVAAFKIAMYPVTYAQFKAFQDAEDGYGRKKWWRGLKRHKPPQPLRTRDNYPVDCVSWFDAVAFCRWLDSHQRKQGSVLAGQEIRLPLEEEWQLAASGGTPEREYPWDGPWDPAKANTDEGGLGRTTAVGLYPAGAAACGALDMAGGVWEWCWNPNRKPGEPAPVGEVVRVLRGGSWVFWGAYARCARCLWQSPDSRERAIGFRVCLSSPIPGATEP